MKDFENLKEVYSVEIVDADSIRFDRDGCHHTGFDAIDEEGIQWGIYEDANGELFLAN